MPDHNPFWTEARLAELRELAAQPGMGSRKIAKLWAEHGITPGQVAGKMFRMNLRVVADPNATHRFAKRPPPPPPPPPPPRIGVMELSSRTCKWPIGHPHDADFHFCGERPKTPTSVYCDEHVKKAYVQRTTKPGFRPAPARQLIKGRA